MSLKINGEEFKGENIFDDLDLDDWEPPVCHCGWVHYEGPCGYMGECDRSECLTRVEEYKKDLEEWHKRNLKDLDAEEV